jgi:hypothetical protein
MEAILVEREKMLRGIKAKIAAGFKSYPLKKRATFALIGCMMLLVISIKWPFEPAKTFSISAYSVGCWFDLKGRWSMFFFGIGTGVLLLYTFG